MAILHNLMAVSFICSGSISSRQESYPEKVKTIPCLFTMRLTGDYDDTYGLTENDVLPYIEPVKQLIQEVSTMALKRINE